MGKTLILIAYKLGVKFAVTVLAWVIVTVVDCAEASVIPSPVHPLKEYPVLVEALIGASDPWGKLVLPVAVPPIPEFTSSK